MLDVIIFSVLWTVLILLGLHVIKTRFRENDVIFMIPCILISVFYVCIGFSPGNFASLACFIITMDNFGDFTRIGENTHLSFLVFSSFLPLHTIWRAARRAVHWEILLLDNADTVNAVISMTYFQVLILGNTIYCDASKLLQYCPTLLDIVDGLEMTETELNPTNPVWVQIMTCLTILLCYVPSLLEIHHLKFPGRTTGSKFSEERFELVQLVSSTVFLVLRLPLLVRNPYEFFLVMKTLIRVFTHYQRWSNLRRKQKTILVEATDLEISTETASRFANEKLSLARFV